MIIIDKRRLGDRMMNTEEQKKIYPAEEDGLRRLLERASARYEDEAASDTKSRNEGVRSGGNR